MTISRKKWFRNVVTEYWATRAYESGNYKELVIQPIQ
jgi:hypothetical protein